MFILLSGILSSESILCSFGSDTFGLVATRWTTWNNWSPKGHDLSCHFFSTTGYGTRWCHQYVFYFVFVVLSYYLKWFVELQCVNHL